MFFLQFALFFLLCCTSVTPIYAAENPNSTVNRGQITETYWKKIKKSWESACLEKEIKMPKKVFLDREGDEVSIRDFKSQVVIVTFFSTWCLPCLQELHDLASLEEFLEQEDAENIAILPIAVDSESTDAVVEAYAENNIERLEVYLDPKRQLMNDLGLNNVPASLIINEEGYITHIFRRSVPWNTDVIQEEVLNLGSEALY